MKLLISLFFFLSFTINSYGQDKYTVYIFMAEECPVCNYIGKSLARISKEHQEQFNFIAVFPQQISNYKTASLFKKKYNLNQFSIELDPEQEITSRFKGTVTPEVVIINTNEDILYQGRINNAYASPGRMRHGKVKEDLELAIQKIAKGELVLKPWPPPIGCYITKVND